MVARLRAAGAVIVGSTNMSEFAFSGVGFNPHYGTPGNPADRKRVPGGSSSGAAVSVADRMAVAALGTDTGGSVRIPAAVCGLVGFKPTARRVPIDGVVPLSTSLDSIGPLANSVECCAIVDAVFAGEPIAVPEAAPLAGLRFAVPRQFVMDELDPRRRQGLRARLQGAVGQGREGRVHRPAAAQRAAGDQRQGRVRRLRGLCLAPAS